jgi:molybdopterin synthase sulfur carrier subunit
MIRVLLPHHLRTLAQINSEVEIQVVGLATQDAIIDALELKYPMLRGTIRDQVTQQRRPFIRFFAFGEDMSLEPSDSPLPDAVVEGTEPFRIVGAMAGG